MTLSEKQRLFAKNVGKLIGFAYANGMELTFGEAFRTPEQQKLYFKQGKSKTLNSKHLIKLAVDFNLFIGGKYMADSKDYKRLGTYWKSLDAKNVWGGDWGGFDGNHFEYGG